MGRGSCGAPCGSVHADLFVSKQSLQRCARVGLSTSVIGTPRFIAPTVREAVTGIQSSRGREGCTRRANTSQLALVDNPPSNATTRPASTPPSTMPASLEERKKSGEIFLLPVHDKNVNMFKKILEVTLPVVYDDKFFKSSANEWSDFTRIREFGAALSCVSASYPQTHARVRRRGGGERMGGRVRDTETPCLHSHALPPQPCSVLQGHPRRRRGWPGRDGRGREAGVHHRHLCPGGLPRAWTGWVAVHVPQGCPPPHLAHDAPSPLPSPQAARCCRRSSPLLPSTAT